MNKLAIVALAATALAALGTGCTPNNDTSVEIQYVCAPPEDAEACEAPAGKCDRYLTGAAWMYLQVAGGANDMSFFLQVANNRPANGDGTVALNSADARITDYILSYDSDGLSIPGYSYSAITVTVPAKTIGTVWVPLIPLEMSPVLQGIIPAGETRLVNVNVAFKGKYIDGADFETGTFKVATYVTNDVFPGYACPIAGEVVTAVCPSVGQTSSVSCAAP